MYVPLKGNTGSPFMAQLGAYLGTLVVMSVSWWLTQPCLYGSVGSTSPCRIRLVPSSVAIRRNSVAQVTFCPLTYLGISTDCYLLVTPGVVALSSLLYSDSSDVTHVSSPTDVSTW